MKILGIDASRANKPRKSGTESYAWHLIRRMQKYVPPETEVLLYTEAKLESSLIPATANWKEKILSWPPRILWTLIRMSAEMIRRHPDVLWIPTHTIPFFAPRTVVTIHDVGFLARPELYKLSDKIYHYFSTRRIVKNAEHIITVSEFSKREIMKFYNLSPERISVTPLAADVSFYKRSPDEIKDIQEKYHIGEPYFIFVGRWEKKKNIDGLLRAFFIFRQKHQKVKLLLVGKPGFGWKESRKNYPLDAVLQMGWVESKDMPALISGALALILPSHYEGFGVPVLEAFACGTPVIASNSGSLPEVGGEAVIYIDPNKPEELAAAINRIYKEPELRAKLASAGIARVKLFSWEKTGEATWNILRRFL